MSFLESTADGLFAITPSDSVDLTDPAAALWVTVAGTVKFITMDDDTVTLTLASGIVHPFKAKRVYATGTTATGIFGIRAKYWSLGG